MTVTTRLQMVQVVSWGQLNCMRVIRNSGAAGYSNANGEVTEEQQREWWAANKHRTFAWLFVAYGVVVGFGMIQKRDDGHWSPSAGVLPEHQGRGYGGRIVDHLVVEARGRSMTLWAQAKLDNPAAVATHHRDYWDRLGDYDGYAWFRSKP